MNIFKEHRSNKHYQDLYIKLFFRYVIALVVAVIIGAFFTKFLNEDILLKIIYNAAVHFEFAFSDCKSISDAVLTVLNYSKGEIICVLISFLFAFSPFNYLIHNGVLICEGFKTGFSISVLYRVITDKTSVVYLRKLHFGFFLILKILILICFLVYLYRLSLHYEHYKSNYYKNYSEPLYDDILRIKSVKSINSKAVVGGIIILLTFIGSLLILNGIYSILLFFT